MLIEMKIEKRKNTANRDYSEYVFNLENNLLKRYILSNYQLLIPKDILHY